MPRISITGASVSVGSVSITPPTTGTQDGVVSETTSGATVTAGKLVVKITNMGFVQAGDTNSIIQVNGNDLSPNPQAPVTFSAELDPVANVFKFTEEITITNTLGSRVRIETIE